MKILEIRKCINVKNDKKYYCFMCHAICGHNENVYIHFQKHFNYKPYICYNCNLTFTDDITLEEHSQEFNHLDIGNKRNYKIEHFLNKFTGLSSIISGLSMESIKKLKFVQVGRPMSNLIGFLNKSEDSIEESSFLKALEYIQNNDKGNFDSLNLLSDIVFGEGSETRNIPKRKLRDSENDKKAKKRKISDDKIEYITINDEDEISVSDGGSDVEITYEGPPLCLPEFIPKPPEDLTLLDHIPSYNSNDVTTEDSAIVSDEMDGLNSPKSPSHISEDPYSTSGHLQHLAPVPTVSNIIFGSNENDSTFSTEISAIGGEDISDDDLDCQKIVHPVHYRGSEANSPHTSTKKVNLPSECEPISDDEDGELSSEINDNDLNNKDILYEVSSPNNIAHCNGTPDDIAEAPSISTISVIQPTSTDTTNSCELSNYLSMNNSDDTNTCVILNQKENMFHDYPKDVNSSETGNMRQLMDKTSKSITSNESNNKNTDFEGKEQNNIESNNHVSDLRNPTTDEVSNCRDHCSTDNNDSGITNNSQKEPHVESHPCTTNENSLSSYSFIDEASTKQIVNTEKLQQGNSKIINKDKNNGYPPHIIRCDSKCSNCIKMRCPKVKSCAKNSDDNWPYNVKLQFSYIYHSNYLSRAIEKGSIECFCNLCETDVNQTGTDMINHIVKKHLHFKRYMFRCRLCPNIETNDIFVVQEHWMNEHEHLKKIKFTNNFILRCEKYNIPDDFCIFITSRDIAKYVDCYKSAFVKCFNFIK
uniref:C2H2-type domain-containing protein n=1 Tax=Strongyloides venezuelensis TaxID=75913 RepID=A0A0K0F7X6_STRVS